MADYEIVVKHHPVMKHYLRPALMVRRGENLSYRANLLDRNINTSASGIRKSAFKGELLGISRRATYEDFDLLAGSSNLFGIGLDSDAETIGSKLSEHLDRAVFTLALPEADIRDLMQMTTEVARPGRTKSITLAPGGTFSRFCLFGSANPMDGAPVLIKAQAEDFVDRATSANPEETFGFLVKYMLKQIRTFAKLAASGPVPFYVLREVTFFDKSEPSAYEREAKLGTAARPEVQQQFDRIKAYMGRYRTEVLDVLKDEGIKMIDYPPADELTFIDEFHPDAESCARIAACIAAQREAAAD